MEYVKVIYPDDCVVYIDGESNGSTNEVLRVETGSHLFALDPAIACQPLSYTRAVNGTTLLAPLTLVFTRRRA